VDPWGSGNTAGPFILRTQTLRRFRGDEEGWITVCKNRTKMGTYTIDGFDREIPIYYEAPAEKAGKG
jgi:hypothetical protein